MIRYILQVQQEISQEYEHVKDISSTLASFKTDTSRPFIGNYGDNYGHNDYLEEPTRDRDVWPPPTPSNLDQRYHTILPV